MQPPLQQANSLQPDTASRLLQSLLHNYNTPKSVVIEQQLNQLKQYQSNRSSEADYQEESRILELMTKKTSQLRNLEELLVREFEEITETKEKYDRVREKLVQVRKQVKSMKEQYNRVRQQVVPGNLQGMKHQMGQLTSQLSVQLQKQLNHICTSYQSQIISQRQELHQNQLIITSLSKKTQQAQQLLQTQTQQISQLKKKLQYFQARVNHESHTRILKSEDNNNNDLELSFGVDKDKVGKKLLGVILHMKSNDSINVGNSDGRSEKFSKERSEKLVEQRKRIEHDFGHSNQIDNRHLQSQISHHSQQQSQILIQSQQNSQSHLEFPADPQFPNQLQPTQQRPLSRSNSYSSPRAALTQSLHRINTSTQLNNCHNDSSSAINKLDIFSELNQQNISQDDLGWVGGKCGNEKSLNEDEADMRKEKVTRSMKVNREEVKYGGYERKRQEQNMRESQYHNKQAQRNIKHPKLTQQQLNLQQTLLTNHTTQPHPPTLNPTSVTQLPQPSTYLSSSQHQESPGSSKNRKSTTRYNYCRLYEEDEIKEIQNINLMCHNVFVAEKIDTIGKEREEKQILGNLEKNNSRYQPERDYIGRKSPLRLGFVRDGDDLVRLKNDLAGYRVSPIRQNRISPIKQSQLSPIKQSPYHRQPISYATPIKQQPYPSLTQLTHHINTSPLLHSKSKKSLTIQIPKSPPQQKLQHLTQSSSKKNPYYRPQQHIHQMRYGNKEFQMEQHRVERVRYYDIPTVSTNDRAKPYSNSNHKQQPYQQGDRKRYIMQKIQLMKRKNHQQSYQPYPQPYKHYEHQQFNKKPSYRDKYPQPNQITKGYDFTQDKFQKELSRRTSEKNYTDQGNNCSRTDLSRLTKPGLSRVSNMTGYVVNDYSKGANLSRDGSRLSYNKAMERSSTSKCGLVINVENQEDEEEHNDIYQQLNSHNHERNGYDHQPSSFNEPYTKKETSSSMIDTQNHIPMLHQPRLPSKSPLKKSNQDQPYFPGSSPLKPSNKHNNSLYLQSKESSSKDHNRSLQQQRKNSRPINTSNYHYQKQEKYTEDNLYRHPYVEKDNGTSSSKTYKKRQDVVQNIGMRRF